MILESQRHTLSPGGRDSGLGIITICLSGLVCGSSFEGRARGDFFFDGKWESLHANYLRFLALGGLPSEKIYRQGHAKEAKTGNN